MKYSVEVEKQSSILRKITVIVPAEEVKTRFDRGLVDVQKTANIKGFRVGNVPLSVVKQYYGDDVRHQVFHHLIDESFEKAVTDHKLKAVGRPKIETPNHQTGEGHHDHTLHEDQDLTFTATFEVVPEVEVKGYTGLSLTREETEVTQTQVDQVVNNLHESQAQLVPLSGGLTLADGTQSVRPVEKGDYVDLTFKGGMVTDSGVHYRDDMKGQKVLEIGSGMFIPGFEDEVIGMRRGSEKTFRIKFPADYGEKELAGKEAEFTVNVQEIKEKKLPALDDEFAKQLGYEGVEDLKSKARDYLVRETASESERKLRSDLLGALIEKNPVEVPSALVQAQTRELAEDLAQDLKKNGYPENAIKDVITQEMGNLKTRAENQVKASLILESIAASEGIVVTADDVTQEISRMAGAMNIEEAKVQDFYAKNPGRKEDLEFKLRQERTVKFLLDKSKIKSVAKSAPAKEK